MALISLVGCNAIGKTTAARRWCARYPGLIALLMDVQTRLSGGGAVTERVRGSKGTDADKRALVEAARADPAVHLFESARTTHLNHLLPGEPAIVLLCSWQTYERNMRARCTAKNKRFRDDYWNPGRMEAESIRRHGNFVRKHLPPEQYRVFYVEDYDRDWPAVDEYFGELYRKLHNRIVRERSNPCRAS